MRSLIQLKMLQDRADSDIEKSVIDWFERCGFRPQLIGISDEIMALIKRNDHQTINNMLKMQDNDNLQTKHAIEILLTIPLAEQERLYALKTAKYAVHFDDHTHGNVIWGLLCIEKPSLTVRWRHKVSKSLERATEEFVANIWKEASAGKLFEPFTMGHSIPVREPNSTTDAYIGEILAPGKRLKERAKKDKIAELMLGKWALIATILCFFLGLALFFNSQPESFLRWFSGALDRLATAGATTTVVSYLSYYFHVWELQRKPIIDWK